MSALPYGGDSNLANLVRVSGASPYALPRYSVGASLATLGNMNAERIYHSITPYDAQPVAWCSQNVSPDQLIPVVNLIREMAKGIPLFAEAMQRKRIESVMEDPDKDFGVFKTPDDPRGRSSILKMISETDQCRVKKEGDFFWINPAFVSQLLGQSMDTNDFRCDLLDRLRFRCVTPLTLDNQLPIVQESSDLTLMELARKIELYLRLEKKFGPFKEELVQSVLTQIEQAALRRTFAAFSSESVTSTPSVISRLSRLFTGRGSAETPSREDLDINQCIRMLSVHPTLLQRFDVFHREVAGMVDLKLSIFFDIFCPLFLPQYAANYRIPFLNGLLLYGPQGCGKTFIAKSISQVLGASFIEYSPGSQGSPFVHQTALNIREVFTTAEKKVPAVIFIDECSSIFVDRRNLGNNAGHVEEELSEFLKLMEGCGTKKILVIGATNYPLKIDPAVLRAGRFDKKFYLPPPDALTRKKLFQMNLKDRPRTAQSIDYDSLVKQTENFVSSDIKLVVDNAARIAARGEEEIGTKHLELAIKQTTPSLKAEMVIEFQKAKTMMETWT